MAHRTKKLTGLKQAAKKASKAISSKPMGAATRALNAVGLESAEQRKAKGLRARPPKGAAKKRMPVASPHSIKGKRRG
jgi:hypothetical protein